MKAREMGADKRMGKGKRNQTEEREREREQTRVISIKKNRRKTFSIKVNYDFIASRKEVMRHSHRTWTKTHKKNQVEPNLDEENESGRRNGNAEPSNQSQKWNKRSQGFAVIDT